MGHLLSLVSSHIYKPHGGIRKYSTYFSFVQYLWVQDLTESQVESSIPPRATQPFPLSPWAKQFSAASPNTGANWVVLLPECSWSWVLAQSLGPEVY